MLVSACTHTHANRTHHARSLAVEDEAGTRAAQRLVRGGGDHVAVVKGVVQQPCRHQAAKVRHVTQHVGAVVVGHLAELCVVIVTRVRGGAHDDELRSEQGRGVSELVVVDEARGGRHLVRHGLEEDGRGADLLGVRLVAMREVAA